MADELFGKERRRELYCEAIRDVGILVLVFAPLDIVVSKPSWSGVWLTVLIGAALMVIAFGVHQDPRSKRQ